MLLLKEDVMDIVWASTWSLRDWDMIVRNLRPGNGRTSLLRYGIFAPWERFNKDKG